ncbi:hypothetical protein EDD85DRAFT_960218 [Armillaria nabsnona]|nr:hypothetical protein EDD85DRAFT_960218 [Armillaria nabsnona]
MSHWLKSVHNKQQSGIKQRRSAGHPGATSVQAAKEITEGVEGRLMLLWVTQEYATCSKQGKPVPSGSTSSKKPLRSTWALSPTCQEDLRSCTWIHSQPSIFNLQNYVFLLCHGALFGPRHPPANAHFPAHVVGHEGQYLRSTCMIMRRRTRTMVPGRPPEILLVTSSTSCPTSSATSEQNQTAERSEKHQHYLPILQITLTSSVRSGKNIARLYI